GRDRSLHALDKYTDLEASGFKLDASKYCYRLEKGYGTETLGAYRRQPGYRPCHGKAVQCCGLACDYLVTPGVHRRLPLECRTREPFAARSGQRRGYGAWPG